MSITTDLSTPIGQIRLEIGDATLSPLGICPNGDNFSDEQILYFYSSEGDHVGRAAARACEILSRMYAVQPTSTRLGPEMQSQKSSEYFDSLAKHLRSLHGYPPSVLNASSQIPSGSASVKYVPLTGL